MIGGTDFVKKSVPHFYIKEGACRDDMRPIFYFIEELQLL